MSQVNDDVKVLQARFKRPEREQLDNWRRAQPEIPPIGEAIRILVRIGLAAEERERAA